MNSNPMTSVFICHPKEHYRQALTQELQTHTAQVHVIGYADNLKTARKFMRTKTPDYCVVGFSAFDPKPLTEIQTTTRQFPNLRIIVVSFNYMESNSSMYKEVGAFAHLSELGSTSDLLKCMLVN